MKNKMLLSSIIFAGAFNVFIWSQVISHAPAKTPTVYFLNIGQGDSSFIELPGGMQAMIDAGPDNTVVGRIESILPISDRYIDIAVMTHPQADHMNGYIDLLKRYRVGVLIVNGDGAAIQSYVALASVVAKTKTKVLVLSKGDSITYRGNTFSVLWPPPEGIAKDPNDRAFVIKLTTPEFSGLFTADIPGEVEQQLLGGDINSDVLKVPHHGSKYSSTKEFLEKVSPRISVIQVGKNSYGHPTKEALSRLAAIGTRVFRNDRDGTIKIYRKNGSLIAEIRQ